MAENVREIPDQPKTTVDDMVDKEIRLRNLKERQNEERQKKLEEIKAQALAAQRFKEQKEQERRRRLDELRVKDDIRRQQVEERKRAINEAERDRLESILRRNQEREARIEMKKRNERSSIVFAFGSSTPRMLDPTDMTASFWGHRRATSTQNITSSSSSLTRRQSERDLDIGNKKRATSASGLERSGESSTPTTPAGCASGYVGRRRTDLVPTIPSRDSSFASSRKSLTHSPGRAYSMSRLDQLAKPRKRPEMPALVESSYSPRPLSSPRISSVTRSMSHLAVSKAGPTQPRRALNKSDSRSMHQLSIDGSLVAPRTTRATQLRHQKLFASSNCSEASSRPSSSLSQQSTTSVASSVSVRHRQPTVPRRQRPVSIAITGVTHDLKNNHDSKLGESKPPLPKARRSLTKSSSITQDKNLKNAAKVKSPVDSTNKNVVSSPTTTTNAIVNNSTVIITTTVTEKTAPSITENKVIIKDPGESVQKPPDTITQVQVPLATANQPEKKEEVVPVAKPETNKQDIVIENVPVPVKSDVEIVNQTQSTESINKPIPVQEEVINKPVEETKPVPVVETKTETPVVADLKVKEPSPDVETAVSQPNTSISNSLIVDSKENISNEMTTSMTKPRINTEEEAKAALAERRRLAREEAERLAEQERLRIEMEAQAELEKQQREEEQVRQLIEQQRAAEQERLQEAIRETQKREEEERLRREEEQRMKVLKEEAEKRAREEAERQKAELQERLKNEEKEREARRKRVEAIMLRTRGKNMANSPSQQNSEDKNENKSENNKLNGTNTGEQENGTKNGRDIEIVDNIIPDDTMKNANTVSIDTINSTDSINSNNSWQSTQQQYDSFM